MSKLPLEGIRVLDVSAVLAAPVCATFLGDFGAEVVKVEPPKTGDFTRRRATEEGGRSLQWVQEGRNKRSITLDLHTEAGRQILRRLVPLFDVVVTNYRPPTLHKWGLDPESLQTLNPRLVALYITGYGLTGPYRERGAFDRVASAFAGLTYVSGESDRPPVRSGYALIDYMTAYLGAFAVVTALYHRDQHDGEGQFIDLALFEAGFRASEDALLDYTLNGRVRERHGNRNPHVVPASDFVSADGIRVALHAGTDVLFRKLAGVMGQPALADNPDFATYHERVKNQERLYKLIDGWAAGLTAEQLEERLNSAGVPASRIMNIADIAADRHYRERGTIVECVDPDYGTISMVTPLPRLSATPGAIRTLGPRLGEHNEEILKGWLGLSDQEISALSSPSSRLTDPL